MTILPPRLAPAFLLACQLAATPAWAQEAPSPEVQAIPKPVKPRQVTVASLRYMDESGNPITSEEFDRQKAAGKVSVTLLKQHLNGDSEVRVRLTTKEALAEMNKPLKKMNPGDSFPEFKLTRLDGTTIDKQSLKGRYTLVNFYFAECGPCVKEVPQLNALANSRNDINFVAVTFDNPAESKRFVAATGFNWPLLPDAQGVANGAGIKAYPSFVLLDRDGQVVDIARGDKLCANGATVATWLDQKLAAAKQ